jgi:6-pyruvoyltetrahydropterin/6-carboxytetrahydropterin synthase
MVCDFKAIKRVAKDLIERLDHSLCLNTSDPQFAAYQAAYGDRIIPFPGKDPTSEVMARWLFDEIRHRLANAAEDPEFPVPSGVRLVKIRVSETSSSWAEYSED